MDCGGLSNNDTVFKNDPANFVTITPLTPELINFILELGPCQPFENQLSKKKFTKYKHNCYFKETFYIRVLGDGTRVQRDWLSYSPKSDKLYCIHCFLFGSNVHSSLAKAWTKNGFNT